MYENKKADDSISPVDWDQSLVRQGFILPRQLNDQPAVVDGDSADLPINSEPSIQ